MVLLRSHEPGFFPGQIVFDVQECLVNGLFTDMAVSVIEGETMYTIRCHRLVLSSTSPYLRDLLLRTPSASSFSFSSSSPRGGDDNDDVSLLLSDTSNHLLEQLISFLYTGIVSFDTQPQYTAFSDLLTTLGINPPLESSSASPPPPPPPSSSCSSSSSPERKEANPAGLSDERLQLQNKEEKMMAMTSYCSERDEHGRHHHVNMIAAASNDNHTNCSNACNHTTNDKKQIGQAQDLLTTVDQSEILYYRFPVSESSARNSMGNGDSDERSCVEDDITTPPCDSPDNSYYALIGPGSQLSPSSSSSSTSSSSSKENDSELDRIISMSIVEEERQEREEKEGSNNGSSSCSGDAEVRRCSSSSSAIYIPDPNEKSVLSNVGNQSWINEDRKRNKRRKKRKNEGQEEEEEEEEEDDDFPSIQKVVEPQQPSESHSKQSATVTSSPTAAAAAAAATTPSYQCSYCDKCFPSQYYLRFHETSVHSKSKSFPCPRCDKIFTGEYYLRQHKRRMHSESRPHACSKCASSFGVKYDLVVHMRKERKKGLLCLMFVIFEHFKRNTPQLGESKIE